jgi:hypothetical protein
MGRLGDHFPEEVRRQYVTGSMVPGQVLRLRWVFPDKTKEKRVLLVCTEPEPLVLIMNSKPSEYLRRDPERRQCELHLSKADHDFLDHDSFLNCFQVHSLGDQPDTEDQIAKSTARLMGVCPDATKRRVVSAVAKSVAISPAQKRAIAAALLSGSVGEGDPKPARGSGM